MIDYIDYAPESRVDTPKPEQQNILPFQCDQLAPGAGFCALAGCDVQVCTESGKMTGVCDQSPFISSI